MPFKFEKLEVYQLALAYVDLIYELAAQLPKSEEYNLKSQIVRAATSVVLNIAEGSTAQSDGEQNRFLGMAVRSVLELLPVSTSSAGASLFPPGFWTKPRSQLVFWLPSCTHSAMR